jgi:hypothetical protein
VVSGFEIATSIVFMLVAVSLMGVDGVWIGMAQAALLVAANDA